MWFISWTAETYVCTVGTVHVPGMVCACDIHISDSCQLCATYQLHVYRIHTQYIHAHSFIHSTVVIAMVQVSL